ncbi:MAG: hypothetical protein DDT21_02700 [Syntrophomonadaceae bacterium]|nr:hypothetical protein [Bacillota bacterium]
MRITSEEFAKLASTRAAGSSKPSAPSPKESDIQKNIKAYLELRGFFVVKIHQSLGSHRGISDLYALKNGRHVWIEVKTPKGRLSEHQQRFKENIEAAGGEYRIARGLDDVSDL